MPSFSQRVQDHLHAAVADRDYHDLLDWTSISRSDATDDIVVQSTLVLSEPDPVPPAQPRDLAAELSDDNGQYEDITVSLSDELAEEAESYLQRVERCVSFAAGGTVDRRAPTLQCRHSDNGARARQYFTINIPRLPFDFEPLAEAVANAEGAYIDDPSRITYVSVQSPLYDPTEYDEPAYTLPDYTVYFTTDTPHEMWGDCETLEDYAEMVASNNEGTTVKDVLGWDTYTNHFHLGGDVEPNEIIATYTERAVQDYLTITDPAFTRTVAQVSMQRKDNDTMVVSGTVHAPLEDLDA